MKVQLETITTHSHRSFTTMKNPRMSDLYFWHFHPEYELVYIHGVDGLRKVGDHESHYMGSDLVLIGSDIPHLNFDFGAEGDYEKMVIHLKKEFVEGFLSSTPEFKAIKEMFIKSRNGLAFPDETHSRIGKKLMHLNEMEEFEQFHSLLFILQELAKVENVILLEERPYMNTAPEKAINRINNIYSFVDKFYAEKISIERIAKEVNMSREAFCRFFKQSTTYTFTEFVNRYRITQAKRYLTTGMSVSETCYQTGFDSVSYFNRVFKKITQENPRSFRIRQMRLNQEI